MEIIFYKSKEHPNFYLVYRGMNGVKPEKHIKKMVHSEGYEDSGFPKIEIEIGFVIKTDAPESLFEYLVERVTTNHIHIEKYNEGTFRAWYEFKDVSNPEKWITDFYSYQQKNKSGTSTIQKVLS